VCAQLTALLRVFDALEHSAKNGRADLGPVEVAALEQDGAHFGREERHGQPFGKEGTVDIAEAF